jgi:carbonic anhydrase
LIDIIFRFDPADAGRAASPRTASEALRDLNEGNRCFANLLSTEGAGASKVIRCDPAWAGLSGAPPQRPFSAVLGCADARVPVELIFHRAVNDLFIVRVAGNILTTEGLGSLEFARANLGESLRLMVVLGHTSCGAVTAAVDAYLSPETCFPSPRPTACAPSSTTSSWRCGERSSLSRTHTERGSASGPASGRLSSG